MGREPLAKGAVITIDNHEFTIEKVCGCGTSSIVYYAADNNQKVIVKEIYPAGLGITRADGASLQVPENNIQFFTAYKDRAKKAFEQQKKLYNSVSTNNSTLFTYTSCKANNTDYYASMYKAGCTLKEWIQKNRNNTGFISDLLLICSRIAGVLQQYHNKGLLHLDIKPDNILVVPIDPVVKIDKNDYYVLMFDFDSVYTLDDLKSEYVRYSPGYVAPEVEYFPGDIDLHRTDIFSVGAILYEGIFGDVPQDDVQNFGYEFDYSGIDALKFLSPQLQPMLTKIFRRTLSIVVSSRYSGNENDDLASALSDACEIASCKYYLANDDIYWDFNDKKRMQRTKELEDIHEKLQEKKAAYLYGAGGTGKTMLAKAYAAKYKNEYVFVQSVRYQSDLDKTLSAIRVIGSNKSKTPAGVELLGEKTTPKTLIIIDNCEFKGSEANELYSLLEQSSSTVRFIITCRTEPDTLFKANNKLEPYFSSYPTDKPDSDFKSALAELFFSNSCYGLAEEESKKIRSEYEQTVRLFAEKYHHIMLTDLASRFANKILNNNRGSFSVFLEKLNKDVSFCKKGSPQYQDQVYDKLSTLFDVADFDDEKKRIMLNACVMAQNSIKEDLFCVMAGIESDKWTNTNSTVNELVSSSWLVREIKRERFGSGKEKYPHIEIHPLIAQVCMEKLLPEVDLEKTFFQTAENLSELFVDLICYDIITPYKSIPQNRYMDMVSNLFRMIDRFMRVMVKTKKPESFSSIFCKTLIDLLSYYVPTNRLYDGITACMIFLRLKPQEKLAKVKLVRIIGLYKEAYGINDLSEPCRKAYSNAVSELCADPSSVLSSSGLTNTEKASILNTLAEESQYGAEQVEYAKKAYELIIKENLKDECALGEIFRCGLTLWDNNCLDEARQCADYLKKGAEITFNYIIYKSSNIMHKDVKIGLTDRMLEYDPQLIMYLVLQGIIETDSGDYERAMIYLLAANYYCDIYDMLLYGEIEMTRQYNADSSALHNSEDESIADIYDIPYCRILARKYFLGLQHQIIQILGLIEADSDKSEMDKENGIFHELTYGKETFFFERGDYEHAAKQFFPPAHFEMSDTDEEKKRKIIDRYLLESRIYNANNNDRKAKLYEERANEIERYYDNRKDIFEEILSDLK